MIYRHSIIMFNIFFGMLQLNQLTFICWYSICDRWCLVGYCGYSYYIRLLILFTCLLLCMIIEILLSNLINIQILFQLFVNILVAHWLWVSWNIWDSRMNQTSVRNGYPGRISFQWQIYYYDDDKKKTNFQSGKPNGNCKQGLNCFSV